MLAQGTEGFWYREFDTDGLLPSGWHEEITHIAHNDATTKILTASSVTSRELTTSHKIEVTTLGGIVIYKKLPWLFALYQGAFKDLAQSCVSEKVFVAKDLRYAVNLNIQRGRSMRYECHVDSNPLEGLLYVTSHPHGRGGALVVSVHEDARGVDQISKNATEIFPRKGKLVFFDARKAPHYVSPLADDTDERIVVTMNYYTLSCSESDRPNDLNKHLGIE